MVKWHQRSDLLMGNSIRRLPRYPVLSLDEERRLIARAQKGFQKEIEELVLRHVGFIIFRIYKKAFPRHIERFGEDIFSQAVFILYDKIKSYDLRYKDKQGEPRPVRFISYIWKRIDGFILDSLKKELGRESRRVVVDWERFDSGRNVHPSEVDIF